jgi:hypothetical protein
MPRFTIELTDDQLLHLQAEVDLHNMNNGTSLTVHDFLQRHARERSITRQLAAEADRLATEHQAAIVALRERLIIGSTTEGDTR